MSSEETARFHTVVANALGESSTHDVMEFIVKQESLAALRRSIIAD
jgi:hypothetical protein